VRNHRAVVAIGVVAVILLGARPVRLVAQARPGTPDSTAALLRQLLRRLDSLERVIAQLRTSAQDTAPAVDELAALRTAANAAAGTQDTTPTEAAPTQFVGRERNQSQLNPEISVTGDVRAYAMSPGPQQDNFDPREFEVGFQSALDPFSHTKIFLALEEGGIDVEEGYAYWTGLPGHIRIDIGKFRQQFGELNRWHLHALPETEYPLALQTYLGEDGLAGAGVSLYRAFGGFGTHEVTAQVTRSSSDDELFDGGARPSYLVHLLNFWQLSRSTYLQLGGTALYGTNKDSDLRTKVGGLDFRLTWRPPARALYREWTLRAELFALDKEIAGVGPTRLGGYVSSTLKVNQRWILGARYDHVESPETGDVIRQLVPSLTWWESEWVFLRFQYRYEKLPFVDATHRFAFQAVWAIGPHKHESY
jgi:hypothetical protein